MKRGHVKRLLISRLNRRDERGAYMVLWALLLVALVTMAAIAIDLSSLRTDRRADRLVADAAVTAAAAKIDLTPGGRYNACVAAWDYAAHNLGMGSSVVNQDSTVCNPFKANFSTDPDSVNCTDTGTPDVPSVTAAMGGSPAYTVTITTPVANTDPLMRSDAIGGGIAQGAAPGDQAQKNSDGTPCQRVGVTISFMRAAFFGGVVGSTARTTTVHSVGRRSTGNTKVPASVVLLDPTDCHVLTQSGSGNITVGTGPGGTNGAVVVVSDASQSSGSGACIQTTNTNDYEIEAGHSNGIVINPGDLYLRAYVGGSCTNGNGHACSQSELGSNIIITSPTGPANTPKPIPSGVAIDRTLVDYIFNCKTGSYSGLNTPNEYNPPRTTSLIETGPTGSLGCNGAQDYVNQYVGAVLAGDLFPSSPTTWNNCASGQNLVGDYDFTCSFSQGSTLIVHGNAHFEQTSSLKNVDMTITGNAEVDGPLDNPANFTVMGNAYFHNSAISLTSNNSYLNVCAPGSPTTATLPAACTTNPPGGTGGPGGYDPSNTGCGSGAGYLSQLAVCTAKAGNDFHTVFIDSGSSFNQNGGNLTLDNTFAYAGGTRPTGGADLTLGGNGGLIWTPPVKGPFVEPNGNGEMSHLALWSDTIGTKLVGSGATHVQTLGGGGSLLMAGVFYTPGACWSLQGSFPAGTTAEAQFIAYCLQQGGASSFTLQPALEFIGIPVDNGPVLIR